ncbi:MAG: response regulator [Deltaproteobacteria bacterium]|nr:response regulator [Deltaproteobacteria bacterium]
MAQKTPIGKILLEKKKIDQEQLGKALEHQKREGGRLASNLLSLGLAGEADLLLALGEQLGLPAVDLSTSIIALKYLDIIPDEVAFSNNILPLMVQDDQVLLAIANPEDQQTIDEVTFVTGKKVEPYVVLEARLKNVIHEAYALRKRDPSIKFYRGERSEFPGGTEDPNGFLDVITQQLPEPDVSLEAEEELITIEVSTSDEILEEMEAGAAQDGTVKVLIVDDEPDIVRLLDKALTAEGFVVISASRGLEALQAVKKQKPSLVLLDAMLPEIHGFEICKKIKTSKRFGHIPVIMISAIYRGWRYAEDVKNTYGADDYFEKPFRIVPLVRRVRELLNAGPPTVESDLDPDAANQAYRKGVAQFKEKQYDQAEESLNNACQLDPFSANIHYAIANVMLATNRVYDAIREYEQTIELKPNLFAPLKNLAILYQKKGFKNKAVEMWERALRCSPDDKTRNEVREQLIKLL